ncbi:hypothetical protein SBA3_2070006 [Candidatus Sulfopaludibacter sp. SbA3]|nr:hypothetical protein SBA3_2070006 [Candidatus Sulfopaludibacter sp. SbA3]
MHTSIVVPERFTGGSQFQSVKKLPLYYVNAYAIAILASWLLTSSTPIRGGSKRSLGWLVLPIRGQGGGGVENNSGAWAISACPIGPLRCFWRPASSLKVSNTPNVLGDSLSANQLIVVGSFLAISMMGFILDEYREAHPV